MFRFIRLKDATPLLEHIAATGKLLFPVHQCGNDIVCHMHMCAVSNVNSLGSRRWSSNGNNCCVGSQGNKQWTLLGLRRSFRRMQLVEGGVWNDLWV